MRKGRLETVLFFKIIRYYFVMIEEFCEIYEYLVSRLYCNPGYALKRTPRNRKMIETFLERSKIKTSEELWNYLSFQIVLSDNQYSGRYYASLTRFLGLNSIKRWNNRTREQIFQTSKFLRERGLRNPLQDRSQRRFSEEYLDFLRHKFWNTARGFILCGEYDGMLLDELKCKDCKYINACSSYEQKNHKEG